MNQVQKQPNRSPSCAEGAHLFGSLYSLSDIPEPADAAAGTSAPSIARQSGEVNRKNGNFRKFYPFLAVPLPALGSIYNLSFPILCTHTGFPSDPGLSADSDGPRLPEAVQGFSCLSGEKALSVRCFPGRSRPSPLQFKKVNVQLVPSFPDTFRKRVYLPIMDRSIILSILCGNFSCISGTSLL